MPLHLSLPISPGPARPPSVAPEDMAAFIKERGTVLKRLIEVANIQTD